MKKLSELTRGIFPGLAVMRRHASDEDAPPTPVINVRDLETEFVTPKDHLSMLPIRPGPATDRYRVAANDVIMTCRGTQLKIARVSEDAAGAIATSNLIVIRPGPKILSAVLFTFLQSRVVQADLLKRTRSSSGQLSFTARDIADLTMPVPPMDVQQRIAELLEVTEKNYQVALKAAEIRRQIGHELAMKMLQM